MDVHDEEKEGKRGHNAYDLVGNMGTPIVVLL